MAKRKPRQAKAQATAQTLVPLARYDAAGFGRRMRGWNAPSTGPNKAISSGMATLRNRARDAVRNEWAASAGVRVWTTNLIGVGIIPRPKTKNAALKARLTALWDAWSAECDADGVLDFYGLQTLVTRTWVSGGECFVRLRPRRMGDGLAVPLQLQVLESDMCPVFDAMSWPGMQPGNLIKEGIEHNRIGRRVAFWMHREHPGDGSTASIGTAELVRVPAEEVLHIYEPVRPGQLRGVTEFAPILAKLRGVMDFDDAVLERQKIANLFTLFVTRPAPTGDPRIDPATGQAYQYDASGAPMAALEPATSQELLPGEDVKFSDPPDAGANYGEFSRQQHLGIAAGQGTPYELLTGDLKDVSDRTLRVIITEFRRHCEQRQWQIIIPQFCQRVRAAWAEAAAMSGAIALDDLAEAARVTWAPHGWAYIHPTQDVQAKKMEQEAGFKSRSHIISERGDDPEEVDAERAEDVAREAALGLGTIDAAIQRREEAQAEEAQAAAAAALARADEARAVAEVRISAERTVALARTGAAADEALAERQQREALAAAAIAEAESRIAKALAEAAVARAEQAAAESEARAAVARAEAESIALAAIRAEVAGE